MKILDSLVKFGKAFSELPNVGKYAVITVALYFAFLLGSNKTESQFTQFRAEYQQLLHKADTLKQSSDSLEARVQDLRTASTKKDSTINRLSITVEWRARQNVKLASELSQLETRIADSTVQNDTTTLLILKDSVIVNLKEQVESKDVTISQQDSIIDIQHTKIDTLNLALDLSEQRADSLEKFIGKLPPAPKDPNKIFGIISKPSRKTVAVVSFVTGVITTIFTIK